MSTALKKILSVLVMAFAVFTCAFALDGNVTWYWFENDSNVEYYRYQIDGEDDDKWVVLDWSASEVTVKLDVSVPHMFYLQQSYDGVNWSASSYTESEVYEEDVEEPVEEVFEEQTETEASDVSEDLGPTEVSDADLVIYDAIEVDRYEGIKNLDVGVGYMNAVPESNGTRNLGLFASFTQTFRKLGVADVGYKANAALYVSMDMFSDISSTQLLSYINCLAILNVKIGNCDVYGGLGPDFSFTAINGAGVKFGMAAELGVRYHRTENILLGFALSDHYYLAPLDAMANRFDLRLFMTKAF